MELLDKYDLYNSEGKNTVEMAKLLKDYGVKGFLYSLNPRSIVMAVLPEDKEHNRKVLNKLKGVMASEFL